MRFGTDGIRGRAGEGALHPSAALRLGLAVGALVTANDLRLGDLAGRPPAVLIGRDSRVSGPMLTLALASGLMHAGVAVEDGGLLPTPAVARGVRDGPFRAGIVVSASHNPPDDNGLKLFDARGAKLAPELERWIEDALAADGAFASGIVLPADTGLGKPAFGAFAPSDATGQCYVEALVREFAGDGLAGLGVVLDCARGAACTLGPALFAALGLRVHATNDTPDGARINVGCGALAPEAVSPLVRATGADLAVCLDGDADRAILTDATGRKVDGDAILAVCALERAARGGMRDGLVVGTVMSNLGLERLLARHGLRLVRADVGDVHVARAMRETGAVLGGEESGHVLFMDGNHPFGDGLYTALQVMRAMRRVGKPLAELAGVLERLPQARRNLAIPRRRPLEELVGVAARTREATREGMRVLVRYSGTEPLARVLVEGDDPGRCESAATALADALAADLATP